MVACTLVQALRLSTGRTVHRGSIGIALLLADQYNSIYFDIHLFLIDATSFGRQFLPSSGDITKT